MKGHVGMETATKQGTTLQCFYGLPSLHLWTFHVPTMSRGTCYVG